MPSPSLSSSALRLPLLDQTFKKRLIVAAGLAVLQALSFPAYSAEPDDEPDSFETESTEDVELQPSYVRPDYVEIERLRTTKEIVVLPKEVIRERGNRTISDVLQSVPGISVGTTGAGEIDIRGQGAGQANRNIQVLIDGAPITTLVNHPMSTNYDVVPLCPSNRSSALRSFPAAEACFTDPAHPAASSTSLRIFGQWRIRKTRPTSNGIPTAIV